MSLLVSASFEASVEDRHELRKNAFSEFLRQVTESSRRDRTVILVLGGQVLENELDEDRKHLADSSGGVVDEQLPDMEGR